MADGASIRCQTCNGDFRSRSALTNHVRNIHQSLVSATFPWGSTLEIKRGSDGHFKCVCGRSLRLSNSLHRHARSCKADELTSEPENILEKDERLSYGEVERDEDGGEASRDRGPREGDADHAGDLSYGFVGISGSNTVG